MRLMLPERVVRKIVHQGSRTPRLTKLLTRSSSCATVYEAWTGFSRIALTAFLFAAAQPTPAPADKAPIR